MVLNDAKRLMGTFLPGRFNLQQHITLELFIEGILERGANDPANLKTYVKLLCAIESNVSHSNCKNFQQCAKVIFSNEFEKVLNKRLSRCLSFEDCEQKTRSGTLRIFGEMYKLQQISKIDIQYIIRKLLESSRPCQVDLHALIEVTGYPLGDEDDTTTQSSEEEESESNDAVGSRCPVCLENVIDKSPLSTNCGHIFCENCLIGCLRHDEEERKCPVCKKRISKKKGYRRIYIS